MRRFIAYNLIFGLGMIGGSIIGVLTTMSLSGENNIELLPNELRSCLVEASKENR